MAQKDEYSRQSSKQNGKVHILLIVFSEIHFHFYVFPMPGLVLFDVVDKNLQVFPQISRFFGLLGLRGPHYIVSTLKFTMGFFKGSFYKVLNYALSAQPCSSQPPTPLPPSGP